MIVVQGRKVPDRPLWLENFPSCIFVYHKIMFQFLVFYISFYMNLKH